MFEEFLTPPDYDSFLPDGEGHDNFIRNNILLNDGTIPDLENVDLALLGVCEDRGTHANPGCADAPDMVRRAFFSLDKGPHPLRMVDLGNILAGESVKDTYIALADVVSELLTRDIIPIIIGGGHDLTYGQYQGYVRNEQIINMAVVDESIDIYKRSEEIDSTSFLYRIFTESPNYLFNFSQIGYQSYYTTPEDIETLQRLYFEFFRLGKIRENFEEVESIIRDADLVSFDISAIRQSDAPGKKNATPNGFFGEEACKIARYAGITDKVTSFGIYEMNPHHDLNFQTTQLAAQMIWYFMDGYYSRTREYPIINEREFVKYMVNFKDNEYELIFWKSSKSGRWWMQVPAPNSRKYERHQLIPCTYADYQLACKEEIPERWLRAYEKLS